MNIELQPRSLEEVNIYFHKANDPEICAMLPRTVTTLDQAIDNYHQSLLPGAASFGRTIYIDGQYVGDVWCYCMENGGNPEAMLSYCIFEKTYWGRGIATEAVALFLKEVRQKFGLTTIGAFCFTHHAASLRVLEKNGFTLVERFVEDGVESCYWQIL